MTRLNSLITILFISTLLGQTAKAEEEIPNGFFLGFDMGTFFTQVDKRNGMLAGANVSILGPTTGLRTYWNSYLINTKSATNVALLYSFHPFRPVYLAGGVYRNIHSEIVPAITSWAAALGLEMKYGYVEFRVEDESYYSFHFGARFYADPKNLKKH